VAQLHQTDALVDAPPRNPAIPRRIDDAMVLGPNALRKAMARKRASSAATSNGSPR